MSRYITADQSAAYYERRGTDAGELCDETCAHRDSTPWADHTVDRSRLDSDLAAADPWAEYLLTTTDKPPW